MNNRFLLLFILLLFTLCCKSRKDSNDNFDERLSREIKDSLIFILKADKDKYKIGEKAKITFGLLNQSNYNVYMIGNLDGSSHKERFPYLYYQVITPKDTHISYNYPQLCSNMEILRTNVFVKVEKGELFDPYGKYDSKDFLGQEYTILDTTFSLLQYKGKYKFSYYYSTLNYNIFDYAGDDRKKWKKIMNGERQPDSTDMIILDRFIQVPKVELQSNILEIDVE